MQKTYTVINNIDGITVICDNNGKIMLKDEQNTNNAAVFCAKLETEGYKFRHYLSYGNKCSITTTEKPLFLLDFDDNWQYSEYTSI